MGPVRVIDSHTGGEPTRVVVAGGPDLGRGPLSERRARFDRECQRFRTGTLWEPRGSEALVGALMLEPHEPGCSAGVLFYNTVGSLGMCGHGTIGLAVSLARAGRLAPGRHRLDTPVGVVEFDLLGANEVAVKNVPSYRHAAGVRVDVAGYGVVTGDVAWGGNWFFITGSTPAKIEVANILALREHCWKVRRALAAAGVTGEGGAEIDHVMLMGPPADPANSARNFTLCPGGAFDRSPCGTGTSAVVACLAAEKMLGPGQTWKQESISGSVFRATYARLDRRRVAPTVTGTAFVTAEATLIFDDADPVAGGVRW